MPRHVISDAHEYSILTDMQQRVNEIPTVPSTNLLVTLIYKIRPCVSFCVLV